MDAIIFLVVQKLAATSPILDAIGIFCASILIWIMVAAIAVFWVLDKKKRTLAAISAFVAALISWLVNQGIGEFVFRPRPFASLATAHLLINKSALDKSFPSDHAAMAFALAMAIFMVDRRWGWAFIVGAVMVSIGRIYVGAHYPTDVLAGAAIGLICAYIIHRLAHKFLRTKHHPAV